MKLNFNGNKGFRLLNLNERLNKGEILGKHTLSLDYGVSEKTIQRDIDDLRTYLAEMHTYESDILIKYDKTKTS